LAVRQGGRYAIAVTGNQTGGAFADMPVIAALILTSRWRGWKLAGTLALACIYHGSGDRIVLVPQASEPAVPAPADPPAPPVKGERAFRVGQRPCRVDV
jgi:hypothetical protein